MEIYKQIEERFKTEFCQNTKSDIPDVIKNVGLKFDIYFEHNNEVTIAEVYATIGKVKSAKKRKIANDCLKMLYAEKLLYPKKVNKVFIAVDDDEFKNGILNIWQTKLFKAFGIELKYYKINDKERTELESAIAQNIKYVKTKS